MTASKTDPSLRTETGDATGQRGQRCSHGSLTHAAVRLCLSLAPLALILFAILCLGVIQTARADDVQVTASIDDDAADAGQSVGYKITVSGATDASVPENINVDGLTITYVGPQTQTQIMFGNGFGSGSHIQRSVVHNYTVVPTRTGEFVIPAQRVTVDGKNYTTKPVTLKVGGAAASSGNGQQYYAEFVLPKNSAYIGEALPIEIRLYVESRVRWQLEEQPEITAEGCTIQKLTKPTQAEVTRDGRSFDMVTFKTSVTAARAGKVTLGPVTVQAVARLPQTRRRSGGPFDDPMFQNPLFNDPFGALSPQQQITIRGEPVDMTVKPLPAAGQPPSFAGAIGTFSLASTAKPTMVEAGDPLTLTVKITGRGDFDRVTMPLIPDPDGWKTYPPSGKFEADDDVGISGAKTFQMAVIPESKKTQSPSLAWSYFDPIKEQYITLTDKGVPIKVEGETEAAASPAIAQRTSPQTSAPSLPSLKTPAPSTPQDILYIRADSAGWGETFQPIYTSRLFWAAQGAPFLALLALAGVQVARKRAADQAARRRAQWRREKEAELAKMQRRDVPEGELYQAAARALRLEAAIQSGRDPDTLDETGVTAARVLDQQAAQRIHDLFDRQDEVLYAGTSGGRAASSAETRVDLLETVKNYENAKPAA